MSKNNKEIDYLQKLIRERIEDFLKKKNMSRRQLAHKTGISEDHLGKMMRGLRPWKLLYLKQVAEGLNVSLDALLRDTVELPVIAEMGWGKRIEIDSSSFDYKAVLPPEKGMYPIQFPELPKSLADKTYVVKITGSQLEPYVLRDSYLYIARNLGNNQNLKDGDLAIYIWDKDNRGYFCRVKRSDPLIFFQTFYSEPGDPPKEVIFGPLAETVLNIDVVVAIVLPRPQWFEMRP